MRRRDLLVSVGSAVACGVCAGAPAAEAGARGCILPKDGLSKLSSTLELRELSERLITTSGDPQIDRGLGRALVRLSRMFDERPGFGFVSDDDSPNAYASRESQVPGTWGTVLFGRTLFNDLLSHKKDKGIAVLAVAAHEFGHVAQFRSGLEDELLRGQKTVKRLELHADFMSGYFLGTRKREDPSISVWAAGKTFYEIGDFQYNNRGHHGTPDERVRAAESGFKYGSRAEDYKTTFRAGADFVLETFS